MSQSCAIMAFRKRLAKRGYSEIRIKKRSYPFTGYTVSAVEPLAGMRVVKVMDIQDMYEAFRF